MSRKAAFVSQKNYELSGLKKSIERAIGLVSFDLKSVRAKKVLLKPNMLGAYPPEMAVTTNPAFVRAVAEIFLDAGATVSIGDSPNGTHPIAEVWETTGIKEVCRITGAREARLEESGSVEKNGVRISRTVAESDFVINLPKFKSHGLTILTLAVKNLFGCVNGMQKTIHHRDFRTTDAFAGLLVKIADAVGPKLTIIDGIVAMEGSGPSAGRPVGLNVIAAGDDIHSLDAACCGLIGLLPQNLDTLAAAKKAGLWNPDGAVEISGDPFSLLGRHDFVLPDTYTKGMREWRISRFVLDRIWSGLSAEPKINPDLCEKCGLCVKSCPVGALAQKAPDSVPKLCKKICIQCFCCHEICPKTAIELDLSIWLKLARWLAERERRKHNATSNSRRHR